ncbi:unnamed protein product [Clavelina lepadiformis]|uniref:RIIa domain-containing protein n=1 Tax=Clavelina lepadiformis TaxID=159417 RepID=A0ABP0FDP5_CLALP
MSKQVRSSEEKHSDVPRRRRRRRYQKAVIDYDEMSVRYGAIKLKVPDGFKQLLENLSREILREQPKNIPRFSAAYFNRLLERREQGYDDLGLVTERIVETDASPSATEEVLQPTVVAAEKAAPAVVVEAAKVPTEEDSGAKPATKPGPVEPEPAAEEEMPDLGETQFLFPYSNSFFYFRLFRVSFLVTLRS